jgi:MFS superfamily sulfate permease-like transporter
MHDDHTGQTPRAPTERRRQVVELASTLALLVASCFLIARLLRLGWIADYFSRPVLIGYLHGVAITLVIAQLGKLLGLEIAVLSLSLAVVLNPGAFFPDPWTKSKISTSVRSGSTAI